MDLCVFVCGCLHMDMCTRVCVCVCVCVWVPTVGCLFVCVCVCVWVHCPNIDVYVRACSHLFAAFAVVFQAYVCTNGGGLI